MVIQDVQIDMFKLLVSLLTIMIHVNTQQKEEK